MHRDGAGRDRVGGGHLAGDVAPLGVSTPMGSLNGTRPLIRPEHLGRALEVVAEALHAPEPAIRFRAAALYLEAARRQQRLSADANGGRVARAGLAGPPAEPHTNGTRPPVASSRKPAANHPWREPRHLSQFMGTACPAS